MRRPRGPSLLHPPRGESGPTGVMVHCSCVLFRKVRDPCPEARGPGASSSTWGRWCSSSASPLFLFGGLFPAFFYHSLISAPAGVGVDLGRGAGGCLPRLVGEVVGVQGVRFPWGIVCTWDEEREYLPALRGVIRYTWSVGFLFLLAQMVVYFLFQ